MGSPSGGYTVIEVIIVIAITALLFGSAVLVFQGQQNSTEFSQAMQDISSKMQNYGTQINAGSYPGSEGYDCTATSGRPVLSSPATTGNSQDCIFLGRAFQVQAGQGTIYSYIVVGTRDIFSGGDTGSISTNVLTSNPTPAGDGSGSTYYLVDSYHMENGLMVLSSSGTPPPASGGYDLVGVYSDLEDASNGASGNPSLTMRGYPFTSSSLGPSSQITSCIEESSCSSAPITQWVLCLGDGAHTAQLEINPTAAGVSTKLNFVACT